MDCIWLKEMTGKRLRIINIIKFLITKNSFNIRFNKTIRLKIITKSNIILIKNIILFLHKIYIIIKKLLILNKLYKTVICYAIKLRGKFKKHFK